MFISCVLHTIRWIQETMMDFSKGNTIVYQQPLAYSFFLGLETDLDIQSRLQVSIPCAQIRTFLFCIGGQYEPIARERGCYLLLFFFFKPNLSTSSFISSSKQPLLCYCDTKGGYANFFYLNDKHVTIHQSKLESPIVLK